jgi:hypothetical protein
MGKKNARDLASDFYSGAFLGPEEQKTLRRQPPLGLTFGGGQDSSGRPKANVSRRTSPLTSQFDDATYEAATKAGYSSNDINKFLKESGVQAKGANFRVAGMGDYQGKRDVFWEVAPMPKAAKAPPSQVSPISAITAAPVTNLLLPDPLTYVRP